MSTSRPARLGVLRLALTRDRIALALLFVLLVLAALLYQYHAFRYFMHDDEGSFAYAAWRISAGEVPYQGFLTEQMPLFVCWGGLVVRVFGRSLVALRLANMALMLLAACFLYALNRELFGHAVALSAAGLFLIAPDAFHNARFFRPEALMLLLELAALYAFALARKRHHLGYMVLAGFLFGLSTISKLFGVLPLAGCFLYLLYACCRERRAWRSLLRQALALGLPAAAVLGSVALVFSLATPYFLTAVIGHHMMQGAGMPLLDRAAKAADLYAGYLRSQPLAILLALAGALLLLRCRQEQQLLLLWQVPTALVFIGMSRELQQRHLAYLTPALVSLIAVALVSLVRARRLLPWHGTALRTGTTAALALVVVALAGEAVLPWVHANAAEAALAEDDSATLSGLIGEFAPDDDALVMSDYPGLNFLSARESTYWAGGISGGAASSGQIRGAMLIDEIQRLDVPVVVINTWGGAHQMAGMLDYPQFYAYVTSHFTLVERYKCRYEAKVFEIFVAPDALPRDWDASTAPPAAGDGAWIDLWLHAGGTSPVDWQSLWTVVQWQDGTGAWHNVEGWQGPPQGSAEGEGSITWTVSPTDLRTGPFRWAVLDGRGGSMLAASAPFQLPANPGETAQVEVELAP